MKAVLLFFGLSAALGSLAQDGRYDWELKSESRSIVKPLPRYGVRDTLPPVTIDSMFKSRNINLNAIMDKRRYIGESTNGPVYALPQDNMPCIMPALAGHGMPNGATPKVLQKPIDPGIYIPGRPTLPRIKMTKPPAVDSK